MNNLQQQVLAGTAYKLPVTKKTAKGNFDSLLNKLRKMQLPNNLIEGLMDDLIPMKIFFMGDKINIKNGWDLLVKNLTKANTKNEPNHNGLNLVHVQDGKACASNGHCIVHADTSKSNGYYDKRGVQVAISAEDVSGFLNMPGYIEELFKTAEIRDCLEFDIANPAAVKEVDDLAVSIFKTKDGKSYGYQSKQLDWWASCSSVTLGRILPGNMILHLVDRDKKIEMVLMKVQYPYQ